MTIIEDTELDIFVASKIGSFKHVKYFSEKSKNNKKCIENLIDIKSLDKDDEITCMEWGNKKQTEVLIGKKNGQVLIYSTVEGFKDTYTLPGSIVGVGRGNHLIAATESTVKIWDNDNPVVTGKLDTLKISPYDHAMFATGGEENDLKIWRIGESQPVFAAKNLAHDWLQLRRPVWVTDMTFLEDQHTVATCSRHGYVRLYDSRVQRRPVCNVECNMAATCISQSFQERQVLVGFGRGQLHNVDLRVGRLDKGYKGCVGAVTSLVPAVGSGVIVSCSLDRHLRIHDRNTKELIYKQYLTSKLTSVLVQTESYTPLRKSQEIKEERGESEKQEIEIDDDLDVLFDNMETVGEKPRKRKKMVEEVSVMNIKPSTEGNTGTDVSEQIQDDAIVKLLKSTEKQKRKREQKKKEKRAKSV